MPHHADSPASSVGATPAKPLALAPMEGGANAERGLAQQRQGRARLLATLPLYVAGLAAIYLSVSAGLAAPQAARVIAGCLILNATIFALLLWSRTGCRFKDPTLAFPQATANIVLIALTYALLDIARAVALELLCLNIVFHMVRLERTQMWLTGALTMLLPVATLLATNLPHSSLAAMRDQLVFLIWGAALVPASLMAGLHARQVRARHVAVRHELQEAVEKLYELSIRDELTGLFNRRHMRSVLDDEEHRYQRNHRSYSLALLDIDSFKRINDLHGHAVGDLVLQQFARLTGLIFGSGPSLCCRWGGEEFLVLLPESSSTEAHAKVLALRELVHAFDWGQCHPGLRVTFSGGIGQRCHAKDAAQAVALADEAMYRAKKAGRDRVESMTPPVAAEASGTAPSTGWPTTESDVIASEPMWRMTPKAAPAAGAVADEPDAFLASWAQWHSPALNLLLGADPVIRRLMPGMLAAAGIYIVLMLALVFHAFPAGLVPLDVGHVLLAMCALAVVVPYALLRSGLTRHFKEKTLIVPQMTWALLTIATAYTFVPQARANLLEIMCVVLIFGYIGLLPRQTIALGMMAGAMLIVAHVVAHRSGGTEAQLLHETLQVAISILTYGLITLEARHFAMVREQVRQECKELAQTAEQIRQLTTHDTLTGLINRRHMQSLLARECERSQQSGHTFGVVLFDLDHFKSINDTHGHQVGDEVLQQLSTVAQTLLRPADSLARWGGEEFLMLLPDAETVAHALVAAERMRQQISTQHICAFRPVTLSAGVVIRQPAESVASILERADHALYRAKAQGRNQCVTG